ncbi:MAG: hypothetical protein QF437_02080, partial [Planctomycetota bacterium]|nr:hypothetical protein [Planctomycetota bacterium]
FTGHGALHEVGRLNVVVCLPAGCGSGSAISAVLRLTLSALAMPMPRAYRIGSARKTLSRWRLCLRPAQSESAKICFIAALAVNP